MGLAKTRHGVPLRTGAEAALQRVWNRYKSNARIRGIAFELTRDQFRSVITQNCYYCGEMPSNPEKTGEGTFLFNGIDRINNDLNYSFENSISCCKICNHAKRQMTATEFIHWVARVHARHCSLVIPICVSPFKDRFLTCHP